MKDSPYLTHDIGARNDPKIIELTMEMRGQGKAIWWDLVEMLWENDGYLPMNFKSLAYGLRYCTPEEVEQVVTRFDLFENDGVRFWSRSALERINHKKKVSEIKATAGRKGAHVTNARRAAADPQQEDGTCRESEQHMPQQEDGTAAADPSAINKLNNKSINQSRNFSIPPSAADRKRLLEIFFFEKSFTNPAGEVERFIGHYGGRGWNFGDGQPVVDLFAAANNWKPEDGKTEHFPKGFRNWYKMVYACYVNAGNDGADMLVGLVSATGAGKSIALTYRTAEIGMRVMNFTQGHQLDAGWQIEWKKSN
ncbi:MAG: DUF4373 domain-containing protein [Bacteroidales bacterium]|nr:DUF4373 domain-containing protein [Bacteroidales bacterium]